MKRSHDYRTLPTDRTLLILFSDADLNGSELHRERNNIRKS